MKRIFVFLLVGFLIFSFGCIGEKAEEKEDGDTNTTKTEKKEATEEYKNYLKKKVDTFKEDVLVTQKTSIKIDYELDPDTPNSEQIIGILESMKTQLTDTFMTFAKKGLDKYKVESSGGTSGSVLVIMSGKNVYQCYESDCVLYEGSEEIADIKTQLDEIIDGFDDGPLGGEYEFIDQNKAYTAYLVGEKTYNGIKCEEFQLEFDKEYLQQVIASSNIDQKTEQTLGMLVLMEGPMIECIDKKTGIDVYAKMLIDMKVQYNIKKMDMTVEMTATEISTIISDSEFEVPAGYTITNASEVSEMPTS